MLDPQKVVDIALSEVGYREKASNSQIDSKTANAGVKNYTKFAAFMDTLKGWYNGRKQGIAWCAVFAHSCVVRACLEAGSTVEDAQKMLFLPKNSSGAGVRYCRLYAIRAGRYGKAGEYKPVAGDEIIFRKVGSTDPNAMQHIETVRYSDSVRVYTVGGNVSNRVMLRSYPLTDPKIDGYVRPNYGMPVISKPADPPAIIPTLKKGSQGMYVTELQTKLNAAGAKPALTVDGIFGGKTLAAVKAYQKAKGLNVDGIVGPVTQAALKAVG
jgi:hypothetical protein